jgi:hypothetical protein
VPGIGEILSEEGGAMKHPSDVLAGDGRVRVLSRRCNTCVTRDGNPFGPARSAEVIEANIAAGALLTCHSTLPYGDHPDFGPAVCAGFWARHAMKTAAGRIARFMLGITRIAPPEDQEAAPVAARERD